jgi:hypothetical protein
MWNEAKFEELRGWKFSKFEAFRTLKNVYNSNRQVPTVVPHLKDCNIDYVQMTIFWDVTPYKLVIMYQNFEKICCLYPQSSMRRQQISWNIGKFLPDFTASHSTRQ